MDTTSISLNNIRSFCSVFVLLIFSPILLSGLEFPRVTRDVHCLDYSRFVDLSWPYDNNTAFWPGGQQFQFTKKVASYQPPDNYWYSANDFKTAEHCGTHIDAPYHFNKNGWKVDEIPLERLITIGAFVNASSETNGNPEYKLPASKLIEWEAENGPFPNNSVVLISFGWASRYGNKDLYMGPNGKLTFPGLSKEAAEWITRTGRIVGVGLDTPSIDQGNNTVVHITLTAEKIFGLENVALNSPLPPLFKIIVLPMKISDGTGGPCRIVALL